MVWRSAGAAAAAAILAAQPAWGGEKREAFFGLLMPEAVEQVEGLRDAGPQGGETGEALASHVNYTVESAPGCPRGAETAIESAAQTWNGAIQESVFCKIEQAPANVTIRIEPDVRDDAGDPIGGCSTIRYEPGGVLSAVVLVRCVQPNGRPMSLGAIENAAEHEMGHLLGLEDGDSRGAVMAGLNLRRPTVEPAGYEADAVRELRADVREIARG